jgi:hypothetical protein
MQGKNDKKIKLWYSHGMDKIRGTPSSEIDTRKISQFPEFSYEKISDVLRLLEKEGKPKNLDEALSRWTEILKNNMKYDTVNYAIFRYTPLEEEQWGFIDKVDPKKLGITEEQRILLRDFFQRLKKKSSDSDNGSIDETLREIIDQILLSLSKDPIDIVQEIMQSPTLQRYLMEDGLFNKKWHGLYLGKNIPQVLNIGIGNCKSLSIISKMILESANIRYGLWIGKIEVIENDEFHVFLRIFTKKWPVEYDPTSIFYKK